METVNTGNGENAGTMENQGTAANSRPSPRRARRSIRKTNESITPAEASQILLSALTYCQQANLLVTGYNEGNALRLSIDGLNYDGGQILPVVTAKE
jgi:hypothetical protein